MVRWVRSRCDLVEVSEKLFFFSSFLVEMFLTEEEPDFLASKVLLLVEVLDL